MSRIFFFLLALFSASSQAFQLSDAMIDAEVIKVNNVVSADANSIKVNVTAKGFKASAPYFQTTATVPKPTFMGFVKGNMKSIAKRSPYYLAWAASIAAAGWAIDELTGEVKKPLKDYIVGYYWASYNGALYIQGSAKSTASQSCTSAATSEGFDSDSIFEAGNPNKCLLKRAGNFAGYFTVYKIKCDTQGAVADSCKGISTPITAVTDEDLYLSHVNQMLKDPTLAADAFMQPGSFSYPYPQLFPTPLKYIPGVSEADYPLLDCYFSGKLQTANPSAPCYAVQTVYDRISALGEKVKVSVSSGGQVEQANEDLKQPLTQAQLEESLNKLSGADVSKVTDDASKIYDSGFKQLNDSLVANTLPSMPDLVPLPQFQTGSCRSFTINFSLAGVNVTKLFPGESGCAQFEKLKQFLGWFMSISVVIALTFAALREAN